MSEFASFCTVYRHIHEMDKTKWEIYGGYMTFESVLSDVMSYYQFQGLIVEHGWFIYGIQSNGTMVQLDQDGTRVCPSG